MNHGSIFTVIPQRNFRICLDFENGGKNLSSTYLVLLYFLQNVIRKTESFRLLIYYKFPLPDSYFYKALTIPSQVYALLNINTSTPVGPW